MSKLTQLFQKTFEKLKKIKHIEIYIAVIFAVLILIIYFSSTTTKKPEKTNPENPAEIIESFSSSAEYAEYLENKLVNVLASVKGAGNVNVIITLEGGFEYIYATEEETKISADGGQVILSKIILVDGKPVLEKEVYPIVKGVVVTASGADDVKVRMNILTALQSVIEAGNITILTGN